MIVNSSKLFSDEECRLPSSPQLENIAHNVLAACPKINLCDSDSMEYSEQVFSLAQSALLIQINKTIITSNKNKESENNKFNTSLNVENSNNVSFTFLHFLYF